MYQYSANYNGGLFVLTNRCDRFFSGPKRIMANRTPSKVYKVVHVKLQWHRRQTFDNAGLKYVNVTSTWCFGPLEGVKAAHWAVPKALVLHVGSKTPHSSSSKSRLLDVWSRSLRVAALALVYRCCKGRGTKG
jgi:hypothetical protein